MNKKYEFNLAELIEVDLVEPVEFEFDELVKAEFCWIVNLVLYNWLVVETISFRRHNVQETNTTILVLNSQE